MATTKTAGTGAALAALMLASACDRTCSVTPERLAALQRGMTQAEAVSVMGCPGNPVPPSARDDGVSSLEWRGPGTIVMATRLDFMNDRLLYYVTSAKGGL